MELSHRPARLAGTREHFMKKLILAALGLYTLGALYKFEKQQDGTLIALSPFLAALAIVFLSRSKDDTRQITY
jgi:hypothetical protein